MMDVLYNNGIKSTHQLTICNEQMGKAFRQNVNRKSIEIKSN